MGIGWQGAEHHAPSNRRYHHDDGFGHGGATRCATAVCRRRGHLWRPFAGGPWVRSWYCVRCETISRTGDGYWPTNPAEVATSWAELKRGQR